MQQREASPSPPQAQRNARRRRSHQQQQGGDAAAETAPTPPHNLMLRKPSSSQLALRILVPVGIGILGLLSVLAAMSKAEPKVPVWIAKEMRSCWDPTQLPIFAEKNASLASSLEHTAAGCLHRRAQQRKKAPHRA